jgi:predicted DNA-binding transcriptional regulator AlpA
MPKSARGTTPSRSFPKPTKAVPLPAAAKAGGPIKLLSKSEVLSILGVSHVTLWSWVKAGSFPPARVLGPPDGGHRSRMGWIDSEVYEHIANAPRKLPKGSKVTP